MVYAMNSQRHETHVKISIGINLEVIYLIPSPLYYRNEKKHKAIISSSLY